MVSQYSEPQSHFPYKLSQFSSRNHRNTMPIPYSPRSLQSKMVFMNCMFIFLLQLFSNKQASVFKSLVTAHTTLGDGARGPRR
jgi:hypothetical protein